MVSVTTGSARDRAAVSAAPSSSDNLTAAGVVAAAPSVRPATAGARWAAGAGPTDGAASSGMINGRSIVGSSASDSAPPGGGAKGMLSYCVCARPSTTRSCGLSSTSSCTSSPSALAASCATELKSSVPSYVSISPGGGADLVGTRSATRASDSCSTTKSRRGAGGGGGGGGHGRRGARLDGGLRRPAPGARQRLRRVAVHWVGREQPGQPIHRFVVAVAALGDLGQDLERQHIFRVECQDLAEYVGGPWVVLLVHETAPEHDVGADVVGVLLETGFAEVDCPI